MSTDINTQELLNLARQLSGLGESPASLSQAHLRKAVSCAYYALFHELIAEAVGRIYQSTVDRQTDLHVISRWYSHSEMKTVCQWVRNLASGGKPPKGAGELINDPPAELIEISDSFVSLQEAPHLADYDHRISYAPPAVHGLIRASEHSISLIPKLRSGRIFENYLMLLLGGPKFVIRLAV